MKTNMRCRGAPKGQPKLFYVLATSLTLSICGLRALVSSFLLACPSGPFAKSSVHTSRRSEGFVGPPGSSGATRGISRPLWRTRPSIVSRVCPSWAIRGTRINEDDVVEDGLNTGEADGADGFGCHRREVHGEQSQELFGRLPGSSISAFGEEDSGGERARSRGGGVARADFVRSVMGGLVTAPMIAGLLSSGEGQAAEAATLDRTRLGTPILTESVLLDLLPISGNGANALRAIQDEIEKATILRTLYRRVNYSQTGSIVEQLAVPPSVWDRVLAVSEGALEMLMEARPALEPVFREMDSAETQIRRAEYSEEVFARTKEALKRMATGARTRLPPSVLSAQEDALLELGRIGELFDSGFPFEIDAGEMYDSIPRLLGRATVDVTVRRDAENPKSKGKVLGNVTMVVDGYSSPVTAGNFIDLALRGFYNELPIRFDGVPAEAQVGADNNETLSTVVSGSFREGFVDPATGALRRLPLEILRVERKGNAPVYGAARNTKVFTKAPAVQTFRIPGAIAMNHPALDGNGASSEFFWLQDDNLEKDGYLMNQGVEALDGRYAIFAYAVGNRKLLGRLKGGDVIEKVTVTYGEDNLIRPKSASFTELLLKGGNGDDAE